MQKYAVGDMIVRAGVYGELWRVVYNEEKKESELRWESETLKKICGNSKMMKKVREEWLWD